MVVALICGAAVFFLGKYLNKDSNPENNVSNGNYTLSDFEKVIDGELYFLLGKEALTKLTDSDKSYMLMNLYLKDDFYTNTSDISITKLKTFQQSTSLKKIYLNGSNIEDSDNFGIVTSKYNDLYLYNSKTDNYSPNPNYGGHGISPRTTYEIKAELQEKNNTYIVTCNYVFGMEVGEAPISVELYYTVDDIRNGLPFKYIQNANNEDVFLDSAEITKYIENNFDTIKDKVDTYTYIFEVEDGQILLTDFYKTKA